MEALLSTGRRPTASAAGVRACEWFDGQAQPQGVDDLADGGKRRVAFTRERFVEALTAHANLFRQLAHVARPGDIAQRGGQ